MNNTEQALARLEEKLARVEATLETLLKIIQK